MPRLWKVGRGEVNDSSDAFEPARQLVYDRASPEEQTRYLELMRTDPVAGMAYLDALGLEQQETEGHAVPKGIRPRCR
jgi:hypothetical protein